MSGVNKAIVLGHAGKDAEVRYTPSGDAVAMFSVATSFKPKDGEEKTEWHRIVAWQRLGEIAGEYIKKGKQVYVEGRIQTRKWKDKEGNERYTTEIVAERIQLLGGGKGDGQRDDDPGPASSPAKPAASSKPAPTDSIDDDIPF